MNRNRLPFLAGLAGMLSAGVPLTGRKWAHHPNGSNGWHGLAPRADRFIRRWLGFPESKPAPRLVINTTPQPWQKAAAKAKARAEKSPPLGFHDRRLAREARKAA